MRDINDKEGFVYDIQFRLLALSDKDDDISTVYPSGIFGADTERSVKSFQRKYGLKVDGKVDYETWKVLILKYDELMRLNEEAVKISPFTTLHNENRVKPGEENALVKIIQIMLQELSVKYVTMPGLDSSGRFDSNTAEAVKHFQKVNRLEESGEVDKDTWNALVNQYNVINRYSN